MPKVHVSTVINAPIDRVWHTVGDFEGLPGWMPGITSSLIEDDKDPTKAGAVRSLGIMGNDGALRERLEELDADRYRIVYSVLEGPLPVDNVKTGMQLRPITDMHGTLGEWFSEFDTEPGGEEAGQQHMTRVFNAGFRALKRKLGV